MDKHTVAEERLLRRRGVSRLSAPGFWWWLGVLMLSGWIALAYRAYARFDVASIQRARWMWPPATPQILVALDGAGEPSRPVDGFGVATAWLLSTALIAASLSYTADWALESSAAGAASCARRAIWAGCPAAMAGMAIASVSMFTPITVYVSPALFSIVAVTGALGVVIAGRLRLRVSRVYVRHIPLSNRLGTAAFLAAWASAGWYLSDSASLGTMGGGLAFALLLIAIGSRLAELRTEGRL